MPDLDLDDLDRARDFIGRETWTFAKTAPNAPHWYVMVMDARDPDEYQWFARLIREHGDLRPWRIPGPGERVRPYRYLTIDGHDYWHITGGYGPPSLNRRVHVVVPDE